MAGKDDEIEELSEGSPDDISVDDPSADDLTDEDIDADSLLDADGDLEDDPDALVVDTVIVDEGSTLAKPDSTKSKSSDDEDDEDDLRVEDDVEADLSAILQEKLTTPQEVPAEDDEEVLSDDRTDGLDRLQPRRPDETQCTQCFYLVRQNAPGCPVEDDACPLFRSA